MPEDDKLNVPEEASKEPKQQSAIPDTDDYGDEMEQKLDERLKHFQIQQQQQEQRQDM